VNFKITKTVAGLAEHRHAFLRMGRASQRDTLPVLSLRMTSSRVSKSEQRLVFRPDAQHRLRSRGKPGPGTLSFRIGPYLVHLKLLNLALYKKKIPRHIKLALYA
jgi:hypothetical protein